jgi:hypothetical protein
MPSAGVAVIGVKGGSVWYDITRRRQGGLPIGITWRVRPVDWNFPRESNCRLRQQVPQ